jgi:hypothetical protein
MVDIDRLITPRRQDPDRREEYDVPDAEQPGCLENVYGPRDIIRERQVRVSEQRRHINIGSDMHDS